MRMGRYVKIASIGDSFAANGEFRCVEANILFHFIFLLLAPYLLPSDEEPSVSAASASGSYVRVASEQGAMYRYRQPSRGQGSRKNASSPMVWREKA